MDRESSGSPSGEPVPEPVATHRSMSDMRRWVEESSYGRSLGVAAGVDQRRDRRARAAVPGAERQPRRRAPRWLCRVAGGHRSAGAGSVGAGDGDGSVPHGGVPGQLPLAAASPNRCVATSSLLRRGKELVFSDTLVETEEGKKIAQISSLVRGGAGRPRRRRGVRRGGRRQRRSGRDGSLHRHAAVRRRSPAHRRAHGRLAEPHRHAARRRQRRPRRPACTRGRCWPSWTPRGRWRRGPRPDRVGTRPRRPRCRRRSRARCRPGTLVGYGWVVQRSGDLFWSDVEIARRRVGPSLRPRHGRLPHRHLTNDVLVNSRASLRA